MTEPNPSVCRGYKGVLKENGAGERNRTPDRLITNQLLYLLSYASLKRIAEPKFPSGAQIVLIAAPRVKWQKPLPYREHDLTIPRALNRVASRQPGPQHLIPMPLHQ